MRRNVPICWMSVKLLYVINQRETERETERERHRERERDIESRRNG